MRKSLLVVIALLAMASLMAAMALTKAKVSNAMNFSVVSTTDAKIGLTPNMIDHPGVAKLDSSGNKMELDFSPGMQPHSSYSYNKLFRITNNTQKTLYVGLRFASCYKDQDNAVTNFPVGLHTITASKGLHEPVTDNGDQYKNVLLLGGPRFRSGAYEGRLVKLEAGEYIDVNFSFINNADQGPLAKSKFTLEVVAKDTPGKYGW